MRYFNEHRRNLIKQNYMRGTKATAQGNKKLELEDTVDFPPCKLEIEGNTEQKQSPSVDNPQSIESVSDFNLTVRGKNLINYPDQHIITDNQYYRDHYTNVILEPSTTYTFSFDYEFVSRVNKGYPTAVVFLYALSTGLGKVQIRGIEFPNYEKGTFVGSFTTNAELGDKNNLVIRIPASDVQQSVEMYARNFMLTKGAYDELSYERYLEPISLSIPRVLESENLLNLKLLANQTDNAFLNEDESVFTINVNGAYGLGILFQDFCPTVKVGDNVTIKFTTTSYEKGIILPGSNIEWKSGQTITVTEDILMSGILFLCFSDGNPTEYYNLRIVNADFEKELKFAKYNDIRDRLVIDNIHKKVIYKQALDKITVTHDKFIYRFREKDCNGIYAPSVLPYECSYQKGFCSHASNLDSDCIDNGVWIGRNNYAIYWSGIISLLGYDSEWADKENPTSGEWTNALTAFRNWLSEHEANGHPFECVYVLPTPIEHDITDTKLGQKLLNLKLPESETVIFEVSSQLSPSSVTLEYYSKTKEDKRKLTVRYNDIDGNVIYESQEYFVRQDSLCQITPPKIHGYEPKNESVCVLVANDTEITLIYNKK